MAIPTDEDIVRFVVRGIAAGQAIVNVLHYRPRNDAAALTTTLEQWLDLFAGMWQDSVLPALSAEYGVIEYYGVIINGVEQVPATEDKPAYYRLKLGAIETQQGDAVEDMGGVVGAALPTYVAATIQKRSGFAGRKAHGSIRLGPIAEAHTEAAQQNVLTDAAGTLLAAAGSGLLTRLPGDGGDELVPVIFNQASMFNPPAVHANTVGFSYDWNTAITNKYVGSQLSRKAARQLGN